MKDLDAKAGNTGIVGEYFYRIETREGDDFDTQCRKWVKWQEENLKNAITKLSFPTSPCSLFQAFFDTRFFYFYDPSTPSLCFYSSFGYVITSPVFAFVYQKSCYSVSPQDFGALAVANDVDAGSLEVFYLNQPNDVLNDTTAKQICCYNSNNCNKFYQVRPSDDCAGYRPPRRRK